MTTTVFLASDAGKAMTARTPSVDAGFRIR
jgi:hypothetical protein